MAKHPQVAQNTRAGRARAQQGIPEPEAGTNVRDLTKGLRSGQLGAEQILKLLMLLTGGQGPGGGRQPGAGPGGGRQAAGRQRGRRPGGGQEPTRPSTAGGQNPIQGALRGRRR